MAANSQSGSFTTLQDWEDRHLQANGNPKAQFWDMSHIGVRSTPINEPAMIERMWDWMGPNEHAWFSRFMPDVRGRYPLETERVNPWNVQMAVEHYGLTPTFNSAVIDSTALKKHPVPIQEVLPAWLELRKQHGMPTNCWQLTAEMLAAYHYRDELPITRRLVYQSNIDERDMQRLQVLCLSDDWPLALACIGVASSSIQTSFNNGPLTSKEHQALTWLQWWMDKSPDCLDNLAWTWIRETDDFAPTVEPDTSLLLDLSQGARDPRDTFQMARLVYGDMRPSAETVIDSTELQRVLGMDA